MARLVEQQKKVIQVHEQLSNFNFKSKVAASSRNADADMRLLALLLLLHHLLAFCFIVLTSSSSSSASSSSGLHFFCASSAPPLPPPPPSSSASKRYPTFSTHCRIHTRATDCEVHSVPLACFLIGARDNLSSIFNLARASPQCIAVPGWHLLRPAAIESALTAETHSEPATAETFHPHVTIIATQSAPTSASELMFERKPAC